MHVYYVSLTRESRSLYRPTVLSVLAVVLVHKPTAKRRQFLNKHSCSFTHLVAHALHLGAIEVSLRLRAAHLEVVLALRLRLRRRGSIASTRRSGPPRRRGRAPPRHPPRAARRRPRLPAAARRREGLRARRERATRREAFGQRVFAVAAAPGRPGNVAPRAAANDAAVDSSLRSTCEDDAANAVDATRRVIARAGGAGGRPRGGGRVEQSRGLPSESERQAREHATAAAGGGMVFLWKGAGRTRDLSGGLFTSRGCVRRWGRFARVCR